MPHVSMTFTRHLVKADDPVHKHSGENDLIKDRNAAPNKACVTPLWVHCQVPFIAVPGRKKVSEGVHFLRPQSSLSQEFHLDMNIYCCESAQHSLKLSSI